jgi:hypothetical protein
MPVSILSNTDFSISIFFITNKFCTPCQNRTDLSTWREWRTKPIFEWCVSRDYFSNLPLHSRPDASVYNFDEWGAHYRYTNPHLWGVDGRIELPLLLCILKIIFKCFNHLDHVCMIESCAIETVHFNYFKITIA